MRHRGAPSPPAGDEAATIAADCAVVVGDGASGIGTAPAPAAVLFRHGRYSNDTNPLFADAASPGAVFPTPPHLCGPIVVPVLISRSHSLPYLECLRHLAARGYRVVALADSRNEPWVRKAYGDGAGGGGADESGPAKQGGKGPGGKGPGAGGGATFADAAADHAPRDPCLAPFEVELVPPELTAQLWADLHLQVRDVAEHGDDPASLAALMGRMGSDFSRALYAWMKRRLAELRPSLVVVDVFYGVAADVCDELGLAYVATTSGLIPGLADAPWTRPLYTTNGDMTTLDMTLGQRLWAATVEPARLLRAALPAIREGERVRRALGVTAPKAHLADPSQRFRGRLTLVNCFFGHDVARPLPPNVRLIGPVRSSGAATAADQGLRGEFASFVEALGGDRAKIALLSFGQNCALTTARMVAIAGGLRRLIARGVIDGAVWSVSMTPEETLREAGLLEEEEGEGEGEGEGAGASSPSRHQRGRILVRAWVPQKALLEHPAVRVFASHGGTESCGEAFYAGKPVLSVPHFSDQPRNSRLIERAGAGVFLSKRALTPESVEQALERVVADPSFSRAALRLRALAVSRGRLITEVTADELEFLLHYGDDHLQQIGLEMGWVKRNNVDLWLAGLGVCAVAGAAVVGAVAAVAGARRGGRSAA
jgi:hypothetical protein